MIGYSPLPPGQSGGITGTLGVNAWSAGEVFVGPLDARKSGLTLAWDIKRRLLSSYTGNSCLVRADRAGQPTFQVPYLPSGAWDTASLLSFAGMDTTYLVRPFSQYGSIIVEQSNAADQPVLVSGGVLNENGAFFPSSSGSVSLTAELNDISDLVSSSAGQIYLRMVPQDNGRPFAATVGGLNSYATFADMLFFDYGAAARINGPMPGGMLGTVTDLSFEHYLTSGNIRVNGYVQVTGGQADALDTGSATRLLIGSPNNSTISAMVAWSTCDATLAAARTAALA